ncbi:chitobiase/beta-hexosaminidase C-terminal domain-containing protein [Clostridium cellulovorans]|uniref:Kelch repeat type 1-containing protein n=2 Tax=Clostridium cellulovorans TaxID=1493 RepID=D9STD2_CLOC7|nr:chitobiase/beta-hexosaminidase C-terminal domain-containing protein [Clostridium cellulovorans]ADL50748.1 Kelch repeat type 1-containing protein [Clostridium cellulovorans 743B]BAV13050.1 peptidase [Clostridium cellulovorans]
MKNVKKLTKVLGIYTIVFSIVFSNFQGVLATTNVDKQETEETQMAVENDGHVNGAKPLTEEEKQWMEENMIRSKVILPNKLGLERSNEVREKKGLSKIDESKAVKVGDEVIADTTSGGITAKATANATATSGSTTESAAVESITGESSTSTTIEASYLPNSVDNSELPFFPEIRSQGEIGSCASFATTYYQATYMTAMARGWDVKNDTDDSKKFSPKWTYNLINGGVNSGSSEVSAYRLFLEQGIATWKDFPYNGNNITQKDYLEWATNENVWKNALNFKADKAGYERISDGTDTPIQNETDDSLTKVKQLISNGYIFEITTDILDWKYKPISNNDLTSEDDKYVGRACAYIEDYSGTNGHGMIVVGYNDNIWVDINSNGQMDVGEKGAFKIANSWGSTWGVDPNTNTNVYNSDGFIWVSYDAINKVSSVLGAPEAQHQRDSIFNTFYWITAKTTNSPSLIACINVMHKERNQLRYEIGYSDVTAPDSEITWAPITVNKDTGAYSFDGSSGTETQGTIVLDYSDLIKQGNLSDVTKRWYVRITDINNDDIAGTNINFKVVDFTKEGKEFSCTTTNSQVNGGSITLYVDHALGTTSAVTNKWNLKNGNPYTSNDNYNKDLITYDNKIYMYDMSNHNLVQYDSINNQWSIYDSTTWPELNVRCRMVGYNGKIYVFKTDEALLSKPIYKMYVYDIATKTWDYTKAFLEEEISGSSIVECNGKIYLIGGYRDTNSPDYNRVIHEYNPQTDSWVTKAELNVSRTYADSVAANGKIYIFKGQYGVNEIKTIEVFDPILNKSSVLGDIPENISFYGGQPIINLEGKIYFFGDSKYLVQEIYEYKPTSNSWTKVSEVPGIATTNKAIVCNNKIYTMVGSENNFYEFNSSVQVPVELERIGIPYFNILNGTYSTQQTVSINCFTIGAKIRYTTDGSTPTETSTEYTGPITVADDMTIKAIAMKAGMTDSYVITGDYKIQPPVANPVLSLAEGNYKQGKILTISSATEGANISYRLTFGQTPGEWFQYTGPINIIGNITVTAKATKVDMTNSDTINQNYRIRSIIGDVNGDGKISISDYIIQKRIEDPNYDLPIDDDLWGGDVTGDGLINNDDYVLIKQCRTEGENFGYFPKEIMPLNVSLKDTPENSVTIGWDNSLGVANIVSYQVYRDGSLVGTTSSTSYTDSEVTGDSDYIYTVRSVLEDGTISNASIPLTVKAFIKTPTFSVGTGTYTSVQTLNISCGTPGATIVYTIDGTEPTSTSEVYTSPISIGGTKTIKAKAIKTGIPDSNTVSSTYTMNFKIGDVNGDGTINTDDTNMLKSYILSNITSFPVEDKMWVADVDGNNRIDGMDAIYINQYIAGTRTKFPKEA